MVTNISKEPGASITRTFVAIPPARLANFLLNSCYQTCCKLRLLHQVIVANAGGAQTQSYLSQRICVVARIGLNDSIGVICGIPDSRLRGNCFRIITAGVLGRHLFMFDASTTVFFKKVNAQLVVYVYVQSSADTMLLYCYTIYG